MSSSPSHYLPHRNLSKDYAPSTKASDISRLLDPSYSSSSNTRPHVYVDHSGDFHDPDYRDFPIVKKARWDDRAPIDEDDEDLDTVPQFSAYHTPTSRRSMSRPRSPMTSSPTTTTTPSSYSPYSQYVTPSPPTSYDDDEVLSSASSHYGSDTEVERKKCFRRSTDSRRRTSASSFVRPTVRSPTPCDYTTPKTTKETIDEEDPAEWTPTCIMGLRRQWQAVQLRLSLGVFRAKRRIRRKVGI